MSIRSSVPPSTPVCPASCLSSVHPEPRPAVSQFPRPFFRASRQPPARPLSAFPLSPVHPSSLLLCRHPPTSHISLSPSPLASALDTADLMTVTQVGRREGQMPRRAATWVSCPLKCSLTNRKVLLTLSPCGPGPCVWVQGDLSVLCWSGFSLPLSLSLVPEQSRGRAALCRLAVCGPRSGARCLLTAPAP